MVQFATLGVVGLIALGGVALGAISNGAQEEARYGLCPTHALRAEFKQAERSLSAAQRGLEGARNGGSLYAAGKLGMETDPAALGRAEARLNAAVVGQAQALAACRGYIAE